MQQTSRCPICNEIMLIHFGSGGSIAKECWKHPNHRIVIYGHEANNQVYSIKILISVEPALWATWHYLLKELSVHTVEIPKARGTLLPWFEPDINDYKKLIEKVKTYLLFS